MQRLYSCDIRDWFDILILSVAEKGQMLVV
jgi:hypothetical protein